MKERNANNFVIPSAVEGSPSANAVPIQGAFEQVRSTRKEVPRLLLGMTGFTLIELLLVLVLLIIMLSFLVLTLRQHAENARINKVSLEVEQVLQAAITYNANYGKWPDNNSSGTCMPDPQSDFVQNYLPNGQAQSSYGYYYCWSAKGKDKQLFSVALQVPDNDKNFAKRLAAHLPNAIITNNPNEDNKANPDCEPGQPCFVRTEVAANTIANSGSQNGLSLVATGNCAKGDKASQIPDQENCQYVKAQDQTEIFEITFDACPPNYEAKINVSPNFNTMPGIGMYESVNAGYSFIRLQAIPDYQSCRIEKNKERCQIDFQVQTCNGTDCHGGDILQSKPYDATARIGASYVVACKMKRREG